MVAHGFCDGGNARGSCQATQCTCFPLDPVVSHVAFDIKGGKGGNSRSPPRLPIQIDKNKTRCFALIAHPPEMDDWWHDWWLIWNPLTLPGRHQCTPSQLKCTADLTSTWTPRHWENQKHKQSKCSKQRMTSWTPHCMVICTAETKQVHDRANLEYEILTWHNTTTKICTQTQWWWQQDSSERSMECTSKAHNQNTPNNSRNSGHHTAW